MTEFNGLKNILNLYNNIIISAHINPDGDAISSCVALSTGLNKLNKNVIILLENYDEKYDFLEYNGFIFCNSDEIKDIEKEIFISLDCGDKLRLGNFERVFDDSKVTINIDHHKSNNNFADYNYVFEKSSTCEIVYELFEYIGVDIDIKIAKAIYTGILCDTGGFRHSNASSNTYKIVSELVKYDFLASDIYYKLFDVCSYESAKLLGIAMDRIELFYDGKVCCSFITKNDMVNLNADKSQLGGIIDNLRNIKGVCATVFIYEKDIGECKVSMRCNGEIDIYTVSLEFGGGGHYKACGFTAQGEINQIKNLVIKKLGNNFKGKE